MTLREAASSAEAASEDENQCGLSPGNSYSSWDHKISIPEGGSEP